MTIIDDVAYRTIDGITLLARLYRPDADGSVKWMIDVHGGAWGSGDRLNNAVIHADLAAHGVGVCALDFRLLDEAQYPAMVDDVSYGIRWFKAQAETLDVEMSTLGALGASSGAQQMGLVAMCPANPRWTTMDPELTMVDASVDFFIAAWPILDPLARYRMVQEAGNERLVVAHDACFASEADMIEGNPYLLLERGEATHTPPMTIIQGTADANVEHTWQDSFADLYRSKGGSVEVHKFDGQPHTFVTADPETAASREAIARIREFVLGL
jgi:acetyl esterase/lipase